MSELVHATLNRFENGPLAPLPPLDSDVQSAVGAWSGVEAIGH